MNCHVAANRRLFQARRKKRINRLTSKSILRNDIPTDRHTAEPSASDKKPRFKYPDELLQEKSKLVCLGSYFFKCFLMTFSSDYRNLQ